jgi:O-antigen ligase
MSAPVPHRRRLRALWSPVARISALPAAEPSRELAWQLPVVIAVLAIGLAAGLNPTLAAAAVVGIVVMVTMVANVTAGLIVFAVVAFLESLPAVAGTASTAKVFGIVLALGWLAAVSLRRVGGSRSLFAAHPLLVTTIVLYTAWAGFSLLWAESPAVAQETFIRYALNFMLFPIVYAALRRPRHVMWLYGVFVGGALLSAAIGYQTRGDSEFEDRLGGAGINPNQLGALLAVACVLAMTLFAVRSLDLPVRLLFFGCGIFCAIAVILTASRGAMLGLAVATLAAPFLVGRTRRLRAVGFVALVGVAVVAWAGAFASAQTVDRLTGSYESGSGRTSLWAIGMRMVEDKPLTGVGAGNFPVSSVHYLLEPGVTDRDEYIIDTPKATHNIYLQVWAELGTPGLVLFLGVLVGSLACAVQAARVFQRGGRQSEEMLARGLVIALVALLAADFFSTEIYSKQLYLLLAAGPALLAMARRLVPARS